MAELGIASAAVGIASFAVQVISSTNALKTQYEYNKKKAPSELKYLIGRFEVFKTTLETIQEFEGHPIVDIVVCNCQSTYREIDHTLEKLLEKLGKKPGTKMKGWKSLRQNLSEDIRDQIQEIGSKLDSLNNTLSTFINDIASFTAHDTECRQSDRTKYAFAKCYYRECDR
ncbi:hypothetical protein N7495_009281 [Penicillium taxi]|uniref:uncharacterized protein n=1 Tax=Penicillium taxi TaxID=168475 RepID=UPI002545308E|nr:uncharacterized protein N7495_009281 [Penicillium taxi]KAJ5884771.1 hypothetical protein N7495_009281 [Penicillium taxi]